MILNARQIHVKKESTTEILPAIILLAIEDVTDMMDVAKRLADHTNRFEHHLTQRTREMEIQISELEKEIKSLRTK
jgi:hypothetical protein